MKIVKLLSIGALFLIALSFLSHWVWKTSGSNTWELQIDKDGAKVYALKAPGSSLKQYKGVTRVKTTLDRAVAAMMDTSMQNARDWGISCVDEKPVESWNSKDKYYIHFYRTTPPLFPYSPREFLLKTQFSQDLQSKAVSVEYIAVPSMLPQNDCCFRVENMHNRWRFTPLENGEIEIEFVQDKPQELGVTYLLVNRRAPYAMNKEKYHQVDIDFIQNADVKLN